jgi:probable HAF family extracellular repeat protein
MKSGFLMCFTAVAFFVALAIPVSLAAQEHPKARPHYKYVDLGTLGGPQSAFGGQTKVLTKNRTAVGISDTTTKDPNYPNQNPIIGLPDPWIEHAFRWKGHFPLEDMGAFPGTNSSTVANVNDGGEAVGLSENGTIDPLTGWPAGTAALWSRGSTTPINLGTLPGGNESFAILVNNAGLIAGISANGTSDPYSLFGFGTQTRAVIWKQGHGPTDIGTLGGPDAATNASGINDRGQVAGFSYTNGTPNSVVTSCGTNIPTVDPFFWDGATMTDVGTLGGTCGFPYAMNNSGQMVGQSDLKGDGVSNYHPFFWEIVNGKGKLTDIGTFGGQRGIATWINDAGEVVGLASTRNNEIRAFLWKKGEKKENLGILKGDACNAAWGINSKTQIIGDTSLNCIFSPQRPFLWENGSMYDLSALFPSGRFKTAEAVFINDSGEIAGDGILQNGNSRAFLLIPCKAGTKGCKGLAAGTTAHPPIITQNPTTMTRGSQSPSDGMAAIRSRGRRYPYCGVGTYQPK